MNEKKDITPSPLKIIALIVLIIGAVGSFYLTIREGRNDKSIFELLLFLGWVTSPFLALFIANAISHRWSYPTRVTIYLLMLIITPFSLLSYSGALQLQGTKPELIFLIIPPLCWLLMAIALPIAESLSRRKSRKLKSEG